MNYPNMFAELLSGLLVSVEIFVLTLVFALPLGLLVALGRMSKFGIVRNVFRVYISVMRGTPLMLQLLVCFFGPYYFFHISLPSGYRFVAVIIAFSLNYAAYFAEIYRGGIESMAVGQYEAARVLGYSAPQTFFKITLVKDTSLAFSLSVLEMFTIAKQISSAHTTMVPFVVAGVFYYIFNFVVAAGMGLLEKRLNYYR